MPKLFNISASGSKGLNSDISSYELASENFSDGNNFKVNFDRIKSFSGTTLVSSPTTNNNAGLIDAISVDSNLYYMLLGGSLVQVFNGNAWYNITSDDLSANPITANDALDWVSCRLGRIPIYNNYQHYPEYWSPQSTTQKLLPLEFSPNVTWKSRGLKTKVIRSHKDFLFAIGLQDGANEYPLAYRWSHPADVNGLPYTWDESDPSSLAGVASIGGAGNNLIDGLTLRDAFVIYSESAINVLEYTGDNFVWRRRELSSSFGLAAKKCVVEVMGKHYLLSDSDVLVTDGNSIKSILSGRVRSKFSSELSSTYYDRSFVVADIGEKEIWFCYPTQNNTYPSKALIYNWEEESVAFRDLSPLLSSMVYTNILESSYTWDNISVSWNNSLSWDLDPASPFSKTLIGVNQTNSSVYSIVDDKSSDSNTFIERIGLIITDIYESTTIVAIYPKIKCQGTVKIQIGSMDSIGGGIRWKDYRIFDPTNSRKISQITTGKLHCFRIESIGSEPFTYSGMDIEYEFDGVR